jgi:hypothetical protein
MVEVKIREFHHLDYLVGKAISNNANWLIHFFRSLVNSNPIKRVVLTVRKQPQNLSEKAFFQRYLCKKFSPPTKFANLTS